MDETALPDVAHMYDVTLKLVLADSPVLVTEILGAAAIEDWLNVELPSVQNPRVDLLGRTTDGGLVHIEIQGTNDDRMALRMAQYGLQIYDRLGRFPQQVVLYFGDEPVRMAQQLTLEGLSFRYKLISVRDLDGDRLIEGGGIGDNIIGTLARLNNRGVAVRRVLNRIVNLTGEARIQALGQLMILAGLRKQLAELIVAETNKMPILNDILDHPVLGREFKRGELTVLRRQIEKRFGSIPATVENRLATMSTSEIEDLSVRLLDASSLEQLMGNQPS